MGHVLMENRNGLVVLLRQPARRRGGGHLHGCGNSGGWGDRRGDPWKGYDTRGFVQDLRELVVTPHAAQRVKGSATDGRTIQHQCYAVSQRKRKRVEEIFGRMKTVGWLRKARYKGVEKIDSLFTLSAAAYNLMRMRNLGCPRLLEKKSIKFR